MQYAKFRAKEWNEATRKARVKFEREVLGVRPTFDTVKKDIPNPHTISPLEWAAMLVLIVLTIFTSFKVGALAVPFAVEALATLTQHTEINIHIQNIFIIVTAFLFMLLATPSLLYFKLLDQEPEILAEKKATVGYGWSKRLTLDYITPRLPYLMVYISLGWLIYISATLPGTPFEQFIPVVAEIGLAALVGNLLKKRTDFNNIVYAALSERTAPYDKRKADYEQDGQYLRILYQIMREDLMLLPRGIVGGKKQYPNAWIETASAEDVDAVIVAEYKRLTGGLHFAAKVTGAEPLPESISVTLPTQPKLDVVPNAAGLRLPPRGQKSWTPEDLYIDLRARGLTPAKPYTEADLSKDYAPGYEARGAWRRGARTLFENNSSY